MAIDVEKIWNSVSEFEEVYNRYAPVLSVYALKFVNQQTAQDVVQDLFLGIWNCPPVLKTSLKSYLFAAVRNACLDHLKNLQVRERYVNRRLVQLQMDEIEYYQAGDTSIIEEEQLEMIRTAIGELPERCKEIFELSYYRNMKSSEIAEHLQLSERTVQNQLYRGLIKLREIITHKIGNNPILFAWIVQKILKPRVH